MQGAWSGGAAFASYPLNLPPAAESLPRHSYERIRLEERCDVGVRNLLNERGFDDCLLHIDNSRRLYGLCLLWRTGRPAHPFARCLHRHNLVRLGSKRLDRRLAKIGQTGINSQCVDHFLDRRLRHNDISNSCQSGFAFRREVNPLRFNSQGRISSEEIEKMD